MLFAYIDPGTGFTIFSLGGWLTAFLVGFLGISSLFFKKTFKFINKYRKIVIVIIIVVTIFFLTIYLMIMNKKDSSFSNKFVVLGFDGLSPGIMEKMMQEGRLRNFSYLRQNGSYRHLSTTNPPQSPVAWAGFATGQNPGKNGIFDFIVRNPNTYGLDFSLLNMKGAKPRRVIKSKCFWQYTSLKKIPTVIITCPVTFPPDKVYGRMLSGMGVPDILGTEGTFTFYTSQFFDKNQDIGGKVFLVKKSPVMVMNLIGPRVATVGGGKANNVKVPFKVFMSEDKLSVIIEYQNNRFELKTGQGSDWKEVTFKIGLFKKVKGIFKFYLVETSPEFKLYISPINFDPRDNFVQLAYPKRYSKELADSIGFYHTQGMPLDTWAVNEKRLTEKPFLKQANEVLGEKKAMLDFELKRFQKGVLFCYFGSPDIIQHMFWRYRDLEHPLYEENILPEYRNIIESWYEKMDNILGEVRRGLKKNDIIIVLSDHGFNTFRRAVHVNAWLRKNGYLKLKDEQAKSGAALLRDVDWLKTKAYAIGFGAIYVNQIGRERDGIIGPGKETELLKKDIAGKMKLWIDGKYNKPIVRTVYKREEIFSGKHIEETPDIYLGFNIGYRASWQTALGSVPERLIEDNLKKWSGSHLFDPVLIPGVFFSNKKIMKSFPSIYDIAPTILKMVGFKEEELKEYDLDGEALW